jgi:trimeric autotransporter adhesin
MRESGFVRDLSLVLTLCCGAGGALGQAPLITTIAGTDQPLFSGDGKPANSVPLTSVFGIATDKVGNVYSVAQSSLVIKITADGVLHVLAGNGIIGESGDGGPAVDAALSFPTNIAVDGSGTVYVSSANSHIRRIHASGEIDTFPVSGTPNFTALAPALATGQDGSLYIADTGLVRRVFPDGTVQPVVGHGDTCNVGEQPVTPCSNIDGQPALSVSPEIYAIAISPSGEIYIAETPLNRIDKIGADGIVHTLKQSFTQPNGMAFDASGNLYVAESSYISEVSTTGNKTILTQAYLPFGVAIGPAGNVYYTYENSYLGGEIGGLMPGNSPSVEAGLNAVPDPHDGGLAVNGLLNFPRGVAIDSGAVYIADTYHNRIRKVTTGAISTIAGNGQYGDSGDGGPAIQASLAWPDPLAKDQAGNLYVADGFRVRRISPSGIISSINNIAAAPCAVAVDSIGNLFVGSNWLVQKVDPSGSVSTFVGTGQQWQPGDLANGPATSVALSAPCALAVDAQNNLYIGDYNGPDVIRKVTPEGMLATIAGGGSSAADVVPAQSAALDAPVSVAVDPAGEVYFGSLGNKVRKLGLDGLIRTVAGTGLSGFSGDGGPATAAAISSPFGIAVDGAGNLFIADSANNRIREVLASPPNVSVTPQQFTFSAASGGAPTAAQTLSLTSPVEGLGFTATVPNDASWLQVNPTTGDAPRLIQVSADPTNLAPSPTPYQTSITITVPNGNPSSFSVPVSFTVGAGQPPTLAIDKTNLSFPFSRQGTARSQTILISNAGGGTVSFTAYSTTTVAGHWLTVSPASGQALPGTPAPLTVTANPTGLSPGTYAGTVTVTAGGQIQSIPVTLTISSLDQAILLSQTGLSFVGVSQGGVLPPQTFGVLNIGTGVMNWKASAATLPSGRTWLQVTPASGSTDAASDTVPTVQVSVDAASLPAGKYYGLVQVDAPGAANSPQVLTVVVQVLSPGSPIKAVIQPTELLFTATAGESSPGSQDLLVYNVAAASKSVHASVAVDPGLMLKLLPTNATLDPQHPTEVVVQPFTNGLAAGVYNAAITFQFSDGNVQSASIRIIVAAVGTNGNANAGDQSHARMLDAAAACKPTKLVLASNTLSQSFAVPVGYPVGLEVNVKDDCGTALTSGSVIASFSNSDPELQLQSLKNGLWNSTWQTNNGSGSAVTITLQASDAQGKLQGKSVVNTSLTATTDQPVFALQGVVSAAGLQRFVPIAPGSIISIYGTNLAGNAMTATTKPLPIQLVDTTVFMAGQALPLFYVSDTQANAQVPFDIAPNATYQLLVTRGDTVSLPVGIDVAPAQPAVFTDTSAAPNQGVIFVVRGNEQFEAKPASPASPGDAIVIFCAGLGGVNPAILAGASADGQQTTRTPTVTIGGLNAPVNFSGLAPGFVGLYQVNAVVPKGVASSNAVPVTINIAGQTSPQVVISVQ